MAVPAVTHVRCAQIEAHILSDEWQNTLDRQTRGTGFSGGLGRVFFLHWQDRTIYRDPFDNETQLYATRLIVLVKKDPDSKKRKNIQNRLTQSWIGLKLLAKLPLLPEIEFHSDVKSFFASRTFVWQQCLVIKNTASVYLYYPDASEAVKGIREKTDTAVKPCQYDIEEPTIPHDYYSMWTLKREASASGS